MTSRISTNPTSPDTIRLESQRSRETGNESSKWIVPRSIMPLTVPALPAANAITTNGQIKLKDRAETYPTVLVKLSRLILKASSKAGGKPLMMLSRAWALWP